MSARILVVDDDTAVAVVLGALLRQAGYDVELAASAREALASLEARPVDLMLTDLRMPGMDGLGLLAEVRARWAEVPVVLLTAHGTVEQAVEAMKRGALDFLRKPFDREEIVFTIGKALRQRPAHPPREGTQLLGASPAMREVAVLLEKAAASSAAVLVRGESGTGKELVARRVHELSRRASGPFVAIHCGGLPDTLLESELFGYERGAFTGAVASKPGRVELAEGGTLFLDEIGDVSPVFQVKLLRFLQDRRFERLGSTEVRTADVRIVAATHRDLEGMVRSGELRADLYYRLHVIPVVLPPLRERPGDVALLARHFAAASEGPFGRATIGDDALARLEREPWPGNVRQLQNFVERLVALGDAAVIGVAAVERELARDRALAGLVAETTSGPAPQETLGDARADAEKAAILDALARARGNRTLAARLLGVSRRTLYNKLEALGL